VFVCYDTEDATAQTPLHNSKVSLSDTLLHCSSCWATESWWFKTLSLIVIIITWFLRQKKIMRFI